MRYLIAVALHLEIITYYYALSMLASNSQPVMIVDTRQRHMTLTAKISPLHTPRTTNMMILYQERVKQVSIATTYASRTNNDMFLDLYIY